MGVAGREQPRVTKKSHRTCFVRVAASYICRRSRKALGESVSWLSGRMHCMAAYLEWLIPVLIAYIDLVLPIRK